MSSFSDTRKLTYYLDVRTKDVELVKRMVTGPDGKPLDLFQLVDEGKLYTVYSSAQLMLDVVFVLCLDQIKEHYCDASFERLHEPELEVMPELKTSLVKRMGLWFGEGIGPEQVAEITAAFKEAIVNFIPNPHQRAVLQKLLESQETLEEALAKQRLKAISEKEQALANSLQNTPDTSESTPETLP